MYFSFRNQPYLKMNLIWIFTFVIFTTCGGQDYSTLPGSEVKPTNDYLNPNYDLKTSNNPYDPYARFRPDPTSNNYDPNLNPYDPNRSSYDPNRNSYDPNRNPYDPNKNPYDPNRSYDPTRTNDVNRRPYDTNYKDNRYGQYDSSNDLNREFNNPESSSKSWESKINYGNGLRTSNLEHDSLIIREA